MPLLKKNNFSNLNAGVLMAIILYGLALYLIPLQSTGFYFDDHYSIESDGVIKKIDVSGIFNSFNTRFLVGLSFALNYKLCALHPAGYRLINLLIHCFNAFLVYLLIKSTLYLYSARKPIFFCRLEWPAFFASMLFLCHPIQTEPVNFITQRFVLMGTFFYLLTLFLYIQYRCQFKKRYMIASMGSAIAAMLCKEFVVTLPLMLALYDFYFLHNETIWKRCKNLLPFFVIVLIVPILLLRTPSGAIGVANIADSSSIQEGDALRVSNHIDITRAHGSIARKQYFLTELNVVCTYVRLMFLPINQNLDYDYPISHVMDGKTSMSGVFLLCLLGLAAVTYKSYRIISFGILWFFIALSVESSIIPIGDVINEYRLYLASVGFVLLVMTLIYMRKADEKRLNMIAVVILIGFSILTYQRNKVWKDELTLWNDTVQKSPHKARPYYSRGICYDNQGNSIQAMPDYTKAIEISPYYAEAYNNRGANYGQQGNLSQAISDLTKAIQINPKYTKAFLNRGSIYYDQKNIPLAISDFTKAIEINPQYAEAYYNRGLAYDDSRLTQAIADYTQAIEINLQYAEAYNNRGFAYYRQNNFSQAIADYTKAIELNPKLAEAYSNRGLAYYSEKEYDKAWAEVHKAEVLRGTVNPIFIELLKQASGRVN